MTCFEQRITRVPSAGRCPRLCPTHPSKVPFVTQLSGLRQGCEQGHHQRVTPLSPYGRWPSDHLSPTPLQIPSSPLPSPGPEVHPRVPPPRSSLSPNQGHQDGEEASVGGGPSREQTGGIPRGCSFSSPSLPRALGLAALSSHLTCFQNVLEGVVVNFVPPNPDSPSSQSYGFSSGHV